MGLLTAPFNIDKHTQIGLFTYGEANLQLDKFAAGA
jgi:hypothetical protein